jgi:hypothetical protein
LDNADQERTEQLENGHSVNLKNLLEYVKNTNLLMNFDEFQSRFEFTLSFFRLCQSIIKQKQTNINKIQEIERMKNDIVDDSTTSASNTSSFNIPFANTNSNKKNLDLLSNKKGFIIEKLQQLVNNSYEKKLIIQWKHPSATSGSSFIPSSSFGLFASGDLFSSSGNNFNNLSSNDLLITDQEIVLALFLHRCNHLSQTLTGTSGFSGVSSLNKFKSPILGGMDSSTSASVSSSSSLENSFSEEHLIYNYTIDMYRIIKLLQERNREEEQSKINENTTISNNNTNNGGTMFDDDNDYYSDFLNENAIVSFIYHTPSSLTTAGENIPSMNNPMSNISRDNINDTQDYIQSIKNPHFDIIKITYNGKRREIFKIDYTRNDCFESIIIFLLIIYVTTVFNYYHYDPLYMDYDEMMESILEKDGLFSATSSSSSLGRDQQRLTEQTDFNASPFLENNNNIYNQRDFRIIKIFLERIIPKYDLKQMLVRYYQQNIQQNKMTNMTSVGNNSSMAAYEHY